MNMNKDYIRRIRHSLNTSKEEKSKRKIVFPNLENHSKGVFADETKCTNGIKLKSQKKKKINKFKTNKKVHKKSSILPNTNTTNVKSVETNIDSGLHSLSRNKMCTENILDVYDKSDDDYFEIEEFSSSRDNLTESFTEGHSGIEEEFIREQTKTIQITSNKIVNIQDDFVITKTCKCKTDLDLSETKFQTQSVSPHCSDNNGEAVSSQSKYCFNETTEQNYESDSSIASIDISNSICEQGLPSLLPCVKYFDIDNNKVVILKECTSIAVYGYFSLKVLKGLINILGQTLDKSSNSVNIYSPRGYSLLILQNVTTDQTEIHLKEVLKIGNVKQKVGDTLIKKNDAVILCSKLQDQRLNFVQKYISQQIFPKIHNEQQPQVIFDPKDNQTYLLENDSWQNIADLINGTTKLLIAGGKGVGKSIFLRYTINKLLAKFNRVRVIDLDPGQSEFYVPGCLSVFTIDEPVLGPNFTHIRHPDRSYLHDISIADPKTFIKIVKALMEYISPIDKIPTLINYMGYAKGLGIKILSTVITLVNPTNIVQIDSQNESKNFPCDLNISNIQKNCDVFGGNHNNLNYRLHKLKSLSDEVSGWKLEPKSARELCLLAYLGEGMTDKINSLTDSNLPMYELHLKSLQIQNIHGTELSPATVNANFVALCIKDSISDIFICLGFGVVRGVDLANDYLVLISQVETNVLDKVTHLVLSSVFLPPSIYMTPQNIRGLMPYVMEGELTSLAQLTKRSYVPAGFARKL